MALATDQYDARFYDAIRAGCQASAAAVVPVVLDRVGPVNSVADVGCGEGWWGTAFQQAGATTIRGFETGDRRESAGFPIIPADLTERIPTGDRFDLAVCLEVAEHLPEASAAHLVAELVRLAPVVVFSAAMPRQGGTGHVNCQPPAYWADLFAVHGYSCDGSLRFDIWDLPEVEPWYKSNLLLCSKVTRDEPHRRPLHLIHPDLWLANR